MAQMALEFNGIGKRFLGVTVLNEVSLAVEKGHVLGLIGENGAGKSTLMNILGGVVIADHGTVRLFCEDFRPTCPADATRAGIAFIHQELNLFPNLSVLDNLHIDDFPRLGKLPFIDRRKARQQTRELLSAVNLYISSTTPVELLTPGEKQLVEIAKALGRDARIIIFDEPTTSLTAAERDNLFQVIERLRREGRTLVYISHTLEDVLRLCDTIAVLRDGQLVSAGPAADYSIDRMISDMVGRQIEQMYPPRDTLPGTTTVLDVQSLAQAGIVKDVSFAVRKGEVLGIFGLMGSGRSELARIIFGLDPCKSGRIALNGNYLNKPSPARSIRHGMAFVTENRQQEGLLMEASVAKNIDLLSLEKHTRFGPLGVIDRTTTSRETYEMASVLQIKSGPIERQRAKHLSGGNQQKVVIAKWLLADPTVLILDEPTRGIDVGAKFEVYSIINDRAEKGTGILLISSELEELTGMCDRILVMSNGQIQAEFGRPDFDRERILQAAFQGRTRTQHGTVGGGN